MRSHRWSDRSRSTRAPRRSGGQRRSTRIRSMRPTTLPRPSATSAPRPVRHSCSPRSGRRTAGARRRSTPGGVPSTWRSACSQGRLPTRRRPTSSCATRWTPRRSRSGGGRAILATPRPRSTPTPTRTRRASPSATLAARAAGTISWVSSSSTGTMCARSLIPPGGARLRAVRVPPRLCRVRVGPRAPGERRVRSPTHTVSAQALCWLAARI